MKNSRAPASGCDAWAEQIVASLHAERDRVRKFLSAQQTRLERAEAALENAISELQRAISNAAADKSEAAGGDGQEDYQRRYEMALDDLRELKDGNLLLQEQLAKARATASALAKESHCEQAGLDWEAEKLRILAALESDLNENDSEQRAQRLKIEDVVHTTEKVIAKKNEEIAEKDSEIRELKRRLEEASKTGPLDQMAAAMEQTLQNDIVIQQERERLQELEEQVRSRMCRAEIEISLERAKLARERAELEERLRSAGFDPSKPAGEAKAAAAEQPARGRWLSRLGLTEADRERGKRR